MVVNRIYLGTGMICRVYHSGEIVFLRDPVIFQELDTFEELNDTLIIHGALQINALPIGLYLDCQPGNSDIEWTYPVQSDNVLTIKQVASATLNGNVLEVT